MLYVLNNKLSAIVAKNSHAGIKFFKKNTSMQDKKKLSVNAKTSDYKRAGFWFFAIPPISWFLFFMLVPLAFLWIFSFGETNTKFGVDITWNLDNYIRFFNPIYLDIFLKSFILSAITTVICLVIGFLIALFISFSNPKYKIFWLILIILPFWINLLIRVFGLITLMGTNGLLNKSIEFLWTKVKLLGEFLNITLISAEFFEPYEMLYNYTAVVIGMVYVSLPFMILPIYSALDKMDVSYLEASLDLGASHLRTIFKVMIPIILPGISFGVFLTFIPSLGTFLIPEMLGGPNAQLIANVIQRQFSSGANWPFGSALSFMLMYVTFLVFFFHTYISSRKQRET